MLLGPPGMSDVGRLAGSVGSLFLVRRGGCHYFLLDIGGSFTIRGFTTVAEPLA